MDESETPATPEVVDLGTVDLGTVDEPSVEKLIAEAKQRLGAEPWCYENELATHRLNEALEALSRRAFNRAQRG